MMYCDGGSFSGSNYTVTTYKGVGLHFRGNAVRAREVFRGGVVLLMFPAQRITGSVYDLQAFTCWTHLSMIFLQIRVCRQMKHTM